MSYENYEDSENAYEYLRKILENLREAARDIQGMSDYIAKLNSILVKPCYEEPEKTSKSIEMIGFISEYESLSSQSKDLIQSMVSQLKNKDNNER